MQRQERILLYVILTLIIIVVAAILVQKGRHDEDEEVYNVSVIVREVNDSFSKGVNRAALDFNADVHIVSDFGSSLRQDEYISREIDNGAGALVILAQTADVTAAADGGRRISVPVIAVGGELSRAACTIAPDNEEAGRMLGMLAVQAQVKSCCIVCPGRTEGYMSKRLEALRETLTENGIEYELCSCEEESPALRTISGKETDALLVPEESMVAAVCRYAGKDMRIMGIGYDSTLRPWLEEGRIDGLVVYSDYDIGYMSVRAAVEEIRGSHAQDVEIGLYTANRENMYIYPVDKILFPIE